MKPSNALILAVAIGLAASSFGVLAKTLPATPAATSPAPVLPPAVALPGPGAAAFFLDRTDAHPVAANTRLVVFRYSDQVSFTVRSLPAAFTNIEMPGNELIQGVYISDPSSWSFHVTEDRRRLLIRPSAPGAYATGVIVSDQRSYEITLIAVGQGEVWFQRVRWDLAEGSAATGIFTASASTDSDAADASLSIPPERLRFGYTVRGRADFAPSTVFDDGVRTWFKLGQSQDMPAIFAITEGGIDVVEVAIREGYAVVPRLSEEWKLKLHGEEVRVRRVDR